MIKGIIFDMDDTLFDCTGTLVDSARKRAAKAMKQEGFPDTEDKIYHEIHKLSDELGAKADVFGIMCQKHNLEQRQIDKIIDAALHAYNSDVVEDISVFIRELLCSGFCESVQRIIAIPVAQG